MHKFSGTLFVSDFDGTLKGAGEISSRNLAAIRHFIDEGGIFTVATGRVLSTFRGPSSSVPFNAPVILGNGSSLYDFSKNRYLYKSELAPSSLADISLFLKYFPSVALEIYHEDDVYTYQANRFTRKHLEIVNSSSVPSDPSAVPTPWTKIIVEDEYDTLVTAKAWLEANLALKYEIIFSNPILLEITPKGATKGNMIKRLGSLLGIPSERIFCAGDNENDLSMVSVCNRFFAPGDCSERLKGLPLEFLCNCADGTIADAIDLLARFNA